MRKLLIPIGMVIVMAVGWVGVDDGAASLPVPKTLTGCVIDGSFYSVDDEVSEATGKRSSVVYRITVREMDLTPYEGKKIRVQGHLLPGDRFTPDPSSLRVLGPCDKASRKAIREKAF
jgi:hypothetical protein